MTEKHEVKYVKQETFNYLNLWALDRALEDGWIILDVKILENENGAPRASYVLGHPLTQAEYEARESA